jgi:hypothetical protein
MARIGVIYIYIEILTIMNNNANKAHSVTHL